LRRRSRQRMPSRSSLLSVVRVARGLASLTYPRRLWVSRSLRRNVFVSSALYEGSFDERGREVSPFCLASERGPGALREECRDSRTSMTPVPRSLRVQQTGLTLPALAAGCVSARSYAQTQTEHHDRR
jgi:hypothetical protein